MRSDHQVGRDSPPPPAYEPAPQGATIPYMRTVSCDYRLGHTPRPPSLSRCAPAVVTTGWAGLPVPPACEHAPLGAESPIGTP